MFKSLENPFRLLLDQILENSTWHSKWLNTLSYLENCGARKIAACEHPTLVKEEMLKHATEEFRHALHLKWQIEKLGCFFENYTLSYMIGGYASLNYLKHLDLEACRLLKRAGFSKTMIKTGAYLLVTYAIELRAKEIYSIYNEALKKRGSKVSVKCILLEEQEHLNEMTSEIEKFPSGFYYADQIISLEGSLCEKWIQTIKNQIEQ